MIITFIASLIVRGRSAISLIRQVFARFCALFPCASLDAFTIPHSIRGIILRGYVGGNSFSGGRFRPLISLVPGLSLCFIDPGRSISTSLSLQYLPDFLSTWTLWLRIVSWGVVGCRPLSLLLLFLHWMQGSGCCSSCSGTTSFRSGPCLVLGIRHTVFLDNFRKFKKCNLLSCVRT